MIDEIQQVLDTVQASLEELRFGQVQVTLAKRWPEHLLQMLKEETPDLDWDLSEADMQGLPYLEISTDLGDFGIFMATYPLLDLGPSGLLIRDVVPNLPEDIPDDFPFLALSDGLVLTRFRQVLALKSRLAGRKPAAD